MCCWNAAAGKHQRTVVGLCLSIYRMMELCKLITVVLMKGTEINILTRFKVDKSHTHRHPHTCPSVGEEAAALVR